MLGEIRKYAHKNYVPLVAVHVNAGKTRKQVFENARKDRAAVIAIDEVDLIILKRRSA